MKISHLKMLLAAEQAGSISRAAARLGIAQASLSRTVREIEKANGIDLFERTGRGVRSSKAGQEYLRHVQSVVNEFDKLMACAERLRGTEVGELNVSIPLRVGRLVIAPLVAGFSQKFPNAAIHVYENLNTRTQELLASREMDVGVFYTPPVPPNLSCEDLGREELYAFGSSALFGEGTTTITMEELASFPLLLQSKPAHYRGLIEDSMRKAGHTPIVGPELETIHAQVSFAVQGEGVTILPFSNLWQEVESGELVARRIIEPAITRGISVAASSNAASPLVRQTITLIKQTFADNCDRARWVSASGIKPRE